MKVVAINGSAHPQGNTFIALSTVLQEIEKAGISTELIQIGTKSIHGCLGCGMCAKKQNQQCVIQDDITNDVIQKLIPADGILIGSPVYYAGMSGALKSLLDRTFYVAGANGALFRHKVGAAVAAVRRAGAVTTVDQINKYYQIAEMLMPASNYWALNFGTAQGEAVQDTEGQQTMRMLGKNMAWLLQLIEYGKDKVSAPAIEPKEKMNFVR